MSKYKRSVELVVSKLKILKEHGAEWCQPVIEDMLELKDIADRLEQAEVELKDEYNRINDWYMNKFDLNAEHTDLEIEALHFTGMIQQTISYLLGSLADIRGDNNG